MEIPKSHRSQMPTPRPRERLILPKPAWLLEMFEQRHKGEREEHSVALASPMSGAGIIPLPVRCLSKKVISVWPSLRSSQDLNIPCNHILCSTSCICCPVCSFGRLGRRAFAADRTLCAGLHPTGLRPAFLFAEGVDRVVIA